MSFPTAAAPSPLALATGLIRAYHQIAPEPQVFVDPLAIPITGVGQQVLTHLGNDDPARRQRRLFLVARHRYAEDVIAEAAALGPVQVLMIGSGLDTFAYRNPHPNVRVFEIDRAAVLDWKRHLLATAAIAVPPTLALIPADLESDALPAVLAEAGFDSRQPTVVLLLGVVMYLSRTAFHTVLGFAAGLDGPTQLIFNYFEPPESISSQSRPEQAALLNMVDALHEHWHTFLAPADIDAELGTLGFVDVRDFIAADLAVRYSCPEMAEASIFDRHLVHAVH